MKCPLSLSNFGERVATRAPDDFRVIFARQFGEERLDGAVADLGQREYAIPAHKDGSFARQQIGEVARRD